MGPKKEACGFRSTVVFIPTIITISILYALILISTIVINVDTVNMTASNQEVTDCIDEINFLLSGSNKLSSTAISFSHMPTFPDPQKTLNENALGAYVEEYSIESKRPDNILKALETYKLDDETLEIINKAAADANEMIKAQAHSIRLINTISYVNIPDNYLKYIPEFSLNSEELSLSDEKKLESALEILLNREYSIHQQTLPDYVKQATYRITSSTLQKNEEISLRIKYMRGFLWGGILLILIANLLLFIVLLKKLVFPITNFAKRIDDNERLETEHALYEANYLAKAYNALLDRHKEFENDLRKVAEIDSLTQLPNRYCYNEFLKKEIDKEKSTCVFLLDINNLKIVNDTRGHSEGDILIKNASYCIKDIFLDKEGKNCYRIGGDEFVAIVDNIDEDTVEKLIQEFNEKQQEYNVSIAIGYSYSKNVKEIGYEKLIMEADKRMYINKEMYKKALEKDTMYS